jgi:hypothetical protein
MPILIFALYAVLLLPWICLFLGGIFAVIVGEIALKFFVFDIFLGICRWMLTFIAPHPEGFGVLLVGFFWGLFGMLLAVAIAQHSR